MRKSLLLTGALFFIVFVLVKCKKEDQDLNLPVLPQVEETGVVYAPSEFPFETLSEYRFFAGEMAAHEPNEGVLPYDVISPLFSDYAKKMRFIWMPNGQQATYDLDSEILDMPEGTIIVKTFYYDNVQPANERRIIETRLLYKIDGEWEFADYIWNDDQTEAFFDLSGVNTAVEYENEAGELISIEYRIPSVAECFTCHKINNLSAPIGPKPQNLNHNFEYTEGGKNQIQKWEEVGYLDNSVPANIETVVDWKDQSAPKQDRARAYLDMNCAHCHREESHCNYRPMRFAWNETEDPDNLGICIPPDELINPLQQYIVNKGSASKSMLYYRLNSVDVTERMPLLGRTVIHEEGLELIRDWINELEGTCN